MSFYVLVLSVVLMSNGFDVSISITHLCCKITRVGLFLLSSSVHMFLSQLLDEDASDAEDVELLMLASQWAGAAYVQQV